MIRREPVLISTVMAVPARRGADLLSTCICVRIQDDACRIGELRPLRIARGPHSDRGAS
jgi:hypothetical protein